jgi:hypothetical protein
VTTYRHAKKMHWPKAYRYKVPPREGARFMWNRYEAEIGRATIGCAVVVGRYAYCLKWADAKLIPVPSGDSTDNGEGQ